MILAIISVLAICTPSRQLEAKLTWHEAQPNDEVLRLTHPMLSPISQTQAGVGQPGRPADTGAHGSPSTPVGYSAPRGYYFPAFFHYKPALSSGVPGREFAGLVAATSPNGPIDRVWVDWNGDKRFEDSEMAKLGPNNEERRPAWDSFVYDVPPKSPFGPVHVKFVMDRTAPMVGLLPTGYMEGVVKLAGRATRVRVVHMNFGGAYGALVGTVGGVGLGDFIVMDVAEGRSSDAKGPRRFALPALLQLAGGSFWEPKIAEDGSSIAFVKDDAPTGTVTFVGATPRSADLTTSDRFVAARPDAGGLALPAGPYVLNGASFAIADGAGQTWTYKAYGRSVIEVVAGSHKTVQAGGPLSLAIETFGSARGRSFILDVRDAGGASVDGLADPAGQAPPTLQLTITGPDGTIVATLQVANLSWGGRRPTSWTPDPGLKPGTYTASLQWDSCPFGKLFATAKFEMEAAK